MVAKAKRKFRFLGNRSNLIFTMTLIVILFASVGAYLMLTSKAAGSLMADFNHDNAVNLIDASIMANNWGANSTSVTFEMGDANSDYKVGLTDAAILGQEWGQTTTPTPTPTPSASYAITSLSANHALANGTNTITITGNGFGATQGSSTVTFGERVNDLGFAPDAKTATIKSWSNTSITVTVPEMSPGKDGYPQTYHKVYVTVGGTMSNSMDFFMDPKTVISGQTITSADNTGNVLTGDGILYDNCTFVATNPNINGEQYGVVSLGQGGYFTNSTFLNSNISDNLGAGSGSDYGVNAIKVVNWGQQSVHDITFAGTHVGKTYRMGIEFVYDTAADSDKNIAIIGCTFEPSGAEPISWNAGDIYGLVADTVIKGFTDGPINQWGGGIEFNQTHYAEVRNTTIYAGRAAAFNISQTQGIPSHLMFDTNTVDFRVYNGSFGWGGYPSASIIGTSNLSYARFKNNTFYTGTSSLNCWVFSDFSDSSHNDFSGSTIAGYIRWGLRYPTNINDYFLEDHIGTNNILPSLGTN